MRADGEGLLDADFVAPCATKIANVLSEVTPNPIPVPHSSAMIFLRADSICLPRTAPAAGLPGSSLGSPAVLSPRESQLLFQAGRKGCAEGSVTWGWVGERQAQTHTGAQ